jgi:Ca2+-binding EF-hand superfamily protein
MRHIGTYNHLATEDEKMQAAAKDFAAADNNGDGVLELEEFLTFYGHLSAHMHRQQERHERAAAAFQHFDTDRNGTIDRVRLAPRKRASRIRAQAQAQARAQCINASILLTRDHPRSAV